MAEYINKEALLKEVYKIGNHPWSDWETAGVISLVCRQPAADVVPVVHGWWEHLEQGWFDLWRCSACGDEWTFEYDPTSADTKVNYCPNCGARMDGE